MRLGLAILLPLASAANLEPPDAPFKLQNVATGKYVWPANGNQQTSNIGLVYYGGAMGDNQFVAEKHDDGCFVLRSATANRFAIVPHGGTATNNAQLVFYPNDSDLKKVACLVAEDEGDDHFVLKHESTGLYVHPKGGSVSKEGIQVVFYQGHPGKNGYFKATPAFGVGKNYGGVSANALSNRIFPRVPECPPCGTKGLKGSSKNQFDRKQSQLLLDTINKMRSCADPPMPVLEWDCGVQCVAQAWADQGERKHSKSCNIAKRQGGPTFPNCDPEAVKYRHTTLDDGTQAWVAENMDGWMNKDWPNYMIFRLLDTAHDGRHEMDYIGPHFISFMWADSTKFGCGYGVQNNGQIFCDLTPQANVKTVRRSSKGNNYATKAGSKWAKCTREGRPCFGKLSRESYKKCPGGEAFRALVSQRHPPSDLNDFFSIMSKFEVAGGDAVGLSNAFGQPAYLSSACWSVVASCSVFVAFAVWRLRGKLSRSDHRELLQGEGEEFIVQ